MPPPPEALAKTAVLRALCWVSGAAVTEHIVGALGSGAGVSGPPSFCFGRSSLEAVMGLQSSSEFFTISVNGVLYLQVCGAG